MSWACGQHSATTLLSISRCPFFLIHCTQRAKSGIQCCNDNMIIKAVKTTSYCGYQDAFFCLIRQGKRRWRLAPKGSQSIRLLKLKCPTLHQKKHIYSLIQKIILVYIANFALCDNCKGSEFFFRTLPFKLY